MVQLLTIQSELLHPETPERGGWVVGVQAAFFLIVALVLGAAGCSSIGFASAAASSPARGGTIPGIAGDGVTDDSVALQTALNKAAGGTINLGACRQMLHELESEYGRQYCNLCLEPIYPGVRSSVA
jgi:hypothetical protein